MPDFDPNELPAWRGLINELIRQPQTPERDEQIAEAEKAIARLTRKEG